MRIRDWSADVCSSDLLDANVPRYRPSADTASFISHPRALTPTFRLARRSRGERRKSDSPRIRLSGKPAIRRPGADGRPSGRNKGGGIRRRRMPGDIRPEGLRSEEHTSELQSLMRISYAVFCLKKKNTTQHK